MGCCNGKRSAAARHEVVRAAAIGQSRPAPLPDGDVAVLLYSGPPGLSLQGPVSGRVYRPGRKGARIDVDRRDVAILLRTNLFETG